MEDSALEIAERRAADLEKTLRNIVAIGERFGASPAKRLNDVLNVAEGALEKYCVKRAAAA